MNDSPFPETPRDRSMNLECNCAICMAEKNAMAEKTGKIPEAIVQRARESYELYQAYRAAGFSERAALFLLLGMR